MQLVDFVGESNVNVMSLIAWETIRASQFVECFSSVDKHNVTASVDETSCEEEFSED